jgi:hypothetical protein
MLINLRRRCGVTHTFDRSNREAKADNHVHCHSTTISDVSDATGQIAIDVYDSLAANQWIEYNYTHPLLECLREKGNIGGPVACMLTFDEAALCIFGEASTSTLKLVQRLADLSKFSVILRPAIECPTTDQR